MHTRDKGKQYELKTARHLEASGCRILDMNYSCKFGEVDIIAEDDQALFFVEVKYRMNGNYGHPSESIHYYKKRNILNTAKWYVHQKRLYNKSVRFDAAIWHKGKLEYYKGAFDYDG